MTTLLESVDVVKDMVGQNRSAAEKMEITKINNPEILEQKSTITKLKI